jgi:hypothetical protein
MAKFLGVKVMNFEGAVMHVGSCIGAQEEAMVVNVFLAEVDVRD